MTLNLKSIWDEACREARLATHMYKRGVHVPSKQYGDVGLNPVDHPFVQYLIKQNIGTTFGGADIEEKGDNTYHQIEFSTATRCRSQSNFYVAAGAFANTLRKYGIDATGPMDRDYDLYSISRHEASRIERENRDSWNVVESRNSNEKLDDVDFMRKLTDLN